jgi:transcriptional regulator with XRE-family HTH domain
MTNYAKRIRDIREDKDYSQQSVAQVLHTTQSQYGKIELGKRKISAEEIITLCKLYNLSADYILGFTNEPKPLPKK